METAVNEFLKTGIFPLSSNVFPNCTFEPEEAPEITQQDKLNSKNILLLRNLLELLACKTKYLPLSLPTSGLLQILCCLQCLFHHETPRLIPRAKGGEKIYNEQKAQKYNKTHTSRPKKRKLIAITNKKFLKETDGTNETEAKQTKSEGEK